MLRNHCTERLYEGSRGLTGTKRWQLAFWQSSETCSNREGSRAECGASAKFKSRSKRPAVRLSGAVEAVARPVLHSQGNDWLQQLRLFRPIRPEVKVVRKRAS
jgi:hypothetical protein